MIYEEVGLSIISLVSEEIKELKIMDRETIERMSGQQLQEEARRYGLSSPADRKQCIDLIMSQVDRNVPQLDFYGKASTPQVPTTPDTIPVDSLTQASMPTNTILQSSPTQAPLVQMCAMMLEQSKQQQILMQQLFTVISLNNPMCSTLAATSSTQAPTQPLFQQEQRASISSASTAQAVKLLSSHISDFMGTEEEDVEAWIHTAERVAQIHAVSKDILLLAATSKLKKTARKWFQLNITNLIESWLLFRNALISRFRRSVMFHVILQKVEARKWNFIKETFHNYAMDKLILMKNLKLPERDAIHLLINGIGSRSLRELAAVLKVSTIDEFLEEMHRITSASNEISKKSPILNTKTQGFKVAHPPPSKDTSQSKDLFCVYCRAKGHLRDDCYKLEKKDKVTTSQPVSKVPSTVATVE